MQLRGIHNGTGEPGPLQLQKERICVMRCLHKGELDMARYIRQTVQDKNIGDSAPK